MEPFQVPPLAVQAAAGSCVVVVCVVDVTQALPLQYWPDGQLVDVVVLVVVATHDVPFQY